MDRISTRLELTDADCAFGGEPAAGRNPSAFDLAQFKNRHPRAPRSFPSCLWDLFSGLLAAIESVLASPSQGGRGLDSCAALLKQTRDAMERRLSAARRDASSLDKALERRQPPPADDGGVEASGETAEECVSRARHRAGLSLVFVNLPSLLCSVAHFVAAAARPPPGQTPGCLLSAPSGVETRDTTSDKHQKEQTELYEKGLLASLKLVRAVILDAAESTDTERYRAPVEEFETDLVEKVIGICTPPNMLWKPEDLVGASNRTKPYERLLPSSMEGYELVFDDGVAKVAGTFSPGFNKPELPNKQRITPERSIRDAVLRVAALIEASQDSFATALM
ncbi:conserved hypothetical protein [Neospora caninum Liverpool]|uniref:Uncharacterized protein n=1 Tax=Neospora caninum (strain Liverpool) TaxID=572307 RepID=F0VAD4_NEOCL|nr:conserved hypothetical protein [Neospora caninum Liverpool]CBZ50623.1 conserved hypothetical protein [Neospora caninum Liverpool]|eukprot:XP_003880656.1 conserved hypothetical protein [Neospora caninum Liverpool]